jgi:hypothetical protein
LVPGRDQPRCAKRCGESSARNKAEVAASRAGYRGRTSDFIEKSDHVVGFKTGRWQRTSKFVQPRYVRGGSKYGASIELREIRAGPAGDRLEIDGIPHYIL